MKLFEFCGGPTQTCICGHDGHSHRFATCDSCPCQRFEARPCRLRKGKCRKHNPEAFFQLEAQIDPAALDRLRQDGDESRISRWDSRFCGIYFIRCEQFVKIGQSANVRQRLTSLQLGVPFELEVVAFLPCAPPQLDRLEAQFHKRFKRLHQRGEWFRLTGHLARFIAKHQEGVRGVTAVA